MARRYRKFDQDFQQGAVRLVFDTGKPIAQVARELGINEGTLGNWCARERRRREDGNGALSESERAELERLRRGDAGRRVEGGVPQRSRAPPRRPTGGGWGEQKERGRKDQGRAAAGRPPQAHPPRWHPPR